MAEQKKSLSSVSYAGPSSVIASRKVPSPPVKVTRLGNEKFRTSKTSSQKPPMQPIKLRTVDGKKTAKPAAQPLATPIKQIV